MTTQRSSGSWKDFSKKGLGYGKKGFDKAFSALDKIGAPVNRLSNRMGSEAFWPTTLDKESEKAARILRSFCKDGFYDNVDAEAAIAEQKKLDIEAEQGIKPKIDRPAGKQRVLVKIPTSVIQNAKGIAIFTTMRTGLWFSGAGGSGILMARIPETGEWSPPSGILLHTAALGFLVGVDIYDCVVIINTYEALEGFKKLRATLGGEMSVTAGPVGAGGILDSEVHKRRAPIWTYMKSRGFYAGVQVDGTIIIERTDENERFYGRKISAHEILSGKVTRPPDSIRTLMRTVKAAQGDKDVADDELPPAGETPGDVLLAEDKQDAFGIPAADDPDPYGVRALEDQGMFIREAGTHNRPTQEVFEFRPSPSSPIYNSFVRQSIDASSPRQSWRASTQSIKSYVSADKGTQTDIPNVSHAPRSESIASSRSLRHAADSPSENPWDTPDTSEDHEFHDDMEGNNDDFEILDASNAQVEKRESLRSNLSTTIDESTAGSGFSRPRLVTIPKRAPPALPPRNPVRRQGSTSAQGPAIPGRVSPSSETDADFAASIDAVTHATDSDNHLEETRQEQEAEGKIPLREGTSPDAAIPKVEAPTAQQLEIETPADVNPDAPVPVIDQRTESYEESSTVDKEEFHSTPTSPVEEQLH